MWGLIMFLGGMTKNRGIIQKYLHINVKNLFPGVTFFASRRNKEHRFGNKGYLKCRHTGFLPYLPVSG